MHLPTRTLMTAFVSAALLAAFFVPGDAQKNQPGEDEARKKATAEFMPGIGAYRTGRFGSTSSA
jgi:hypothetical protein